MLCINGTATLSVSKIKEKPDIFVQLSALEFEASWKNIQQYDSFLIILVLSFGTYATVASPSMLTK